MHRLYLRSGLRSVEVRSIVDSGPSAWQRVNYEEVDLKDYLEVLEAVPPMKGYFVFYNHERLHQPLGYQTPEANHFGMGQRA
jgi:hypothetical protein